MQLEESFKLQVARVFLRFNAPLIPIEHCLLLTFTLTEFFFTS